MIGHFPVFFQSTDENSFVVDKPEQAKITEKVSTALPALQTLQSTALHFVLNLLRALVIRWSCQQETALHLKKAAAGKCYGVATLTVIRAKTHVTIARRSP